MKENNENGVEKALNVKKQLDKIHTLDEQMKSDKLNA